MTISKISPQDLFTNGLIESPLCIHAQLTNQSIQAILDQSGTVDIDNQTYSDIESAMLAIPREMNSTSNAWQFWTFYSDERKAWTPLEHLRAQLETQQKPKEIKTSRSHPLRIDEVSMPDATGKIGLTFCPGKVCEGLYGGTWDRDLTTDIEAILAWGGSTLITLMETHEFDLLGVPKFPKTLKGSNLKWLHLPIKDMQTPDKAFENSWSKVGPSLHQKLKDGESIVIHCRGGLGRTGLLAARMLCEAGVNPTEAVAKIRTARLNSIETYAQEHYVLTQAWIN